MKIKFLGTAAAEGVPALFCNCPACEHARKAGGKDIRTRSQALIDDCLLIDFPADTYMHVLQYGLKLHEINHVIITHTHSDHFYIDDIHMRSTGFSNLDASCPLNVYGSAQVFETLSKDRICIKMMDKGLLHIHKMRAFETYDILGYKVTPLSADHPTAEEPFIYLIEKEGKFLLYGHDTGYFPQDTMDYLKGLNIEIGFATFDCCYSLNHRSKNHMGFDEVLTMNERLKEIGVITDKTILCVNHFSHNGCETFENMNRHTMKYGVLTAYDSMETEF
ncbi:MAG: hypothetical protein IJ408_04050 [Clostridia bacterium]|nr:hypothetical protein [Clostridia bacterium]